MVDRVVATTVASLPVGLARQFQVDTAGIRACLHVRARSAVAVRWLRAEMPFQPSSTDPALLIAPTSSAYEAVELFDELLRRGGAENLLPLEPDPNSFSLLDPFVYAVITDQTYWDAVLAVARLTFITSRK